MGKEAIGHSESFLDFQEKLSKVAPVNRSVLLIGERGTGKELAASRLHYLSGRWKKPFVTLNCATLSPTLIESELFGYEKGAFTGAEERRSGRFEMADGGTLFLDEIGSIPLEAQEKILRVVEYGSFERVGSVRPIEVDVRIVGATNVDLKQLSEKQKFKRDLLDRLSFEVLFLPPLRYRLDDIMLLANHFATRMSYELGIDEVITFSERATQILLSYQWPGNIRELKNVIERAVYRSDSAMIQDVVFDPFVTPYLTKCENSENEAYKKQEESSVTDVEVDDVPFIQAVEQLEKKLLNRALKKTNFNRKQAASLLDLTYDQLRGKLKKYGDDVY